MKKFFILAVLFLTAAIPALGASVSDTVVDAGIGDDSINASYQIASFSITITPRGSGLVETTANVIGTHPLMTRIGFPTIAIFERNNSNDSWRTVRTVSTQWNPNAFAGSHSYVLSYQGVAGRQYRAEAQFFARDSQGSDTRAANSPFITAN